MDNIFVDVSRIKREPCDIVFHRIKEEKLKSEFAIEDEGGYLKQEPFKNICLPVKVEVKDELLAVVMLQWDDTHAKQEFKQEHHHITIEEHLVASAAPTATSKLFTLTPLRAQQYEPFVRKDELAYPEILDCDCANKKMMMPQIIEGSFEKRPVGRPKSQSRKRSAKKCGRLWEFIRDMLHDPNYCPSIIRWVDHDKGLFKFERSDAVARVWGDIKKNPKMNYEKLSRAMRYYYKSKVLMVVEHQRLVYRFGPNAKGWQTDNPNFEKPIAIL